MRTGTPFTRAAQSRPPHIGKTPAWQSTAPLAACIANPLVYAIVPQKLENPVLEARLKSCLGLLFLVGLLSSAVWAAQDQTGSSPMDQGLSKAIGAGRVECKSDDPKPVVVCGRSQRRFRIDPDILEATRKAQAPPAKPLLDASTAQACTGPNCGGATIPLVGMALTAVKAAVLASQGKDGRGVLQDSKASNSGIRIGVSVGTRQ